MAFTSIPFVVRTVQPVLEELGPEYEEAAETLGATRWQSFRKVVLPELSPALLAGIALSFTRSLGEFGAVIFIAGNIAWKTEVTSLMILSAYRSLITRRRAQLPRSFLPHRCCCSTQLTLCKVALVDAW